jgi:transposase, IS5 family
VLILGRSGAVYKKEKSHQLNKNEKRYRSKPLTEEQKASNKEKSGTRIRVEYLFAFVENNMYGSIVRIIGITRLKQK